MRASSHDVIVIGGGPAGSCAANLLAQAGADVVVLERERFPRFHIGESLLPAELGVMARLGVDPDAVPFLRKNGAVFVDERDDRYTRFAFSEGLPGTPPHAHQVERSIFDEQLLRAAGRAGVEVREGHEVVEVELGLGEHVCVHARDREAEEDRRFEARYLVDASGQKALLGRRGKTLDPYRKFGRAAAYRHYEKLDPAVVDQLHETGDIFIKLVEDGWMWLIPLISGAVSIGIVKTKGKVEPSVLEQAIADSPLFLGMIAGAEAQPIHVVGNFSYRNTAPSGPRYACIGDAACFLDPIFSSGVAMAMAGAERLADILAPALARGCEHEPELMAPLYEHMGLAYAVFERFIERFYSTRLVDNVLLAERHGNQIFRSGVVSLLAADVWRDDNPFQNMLLRARRR